MTLQRPLLSTCALVAWSGFGALFAAQSAQTPAAPLERLRQARTIVEADCSAARVGEAIPASAIGEPVGAVTIAAPRWVAATDSLQARCEVDGSIEPVDRSATARPIKFRVWLPAEWNGRAGQQGGGGMNGSIPDLSGARYPIGGRSAAQLGFATFGSDSGHQMTPGPQEWTLNDEAMKNLGYAQLKKTRDAAMVLIERVYGARPRYTYFTGTSQGGREALTVAQRYPGDYDGVIANVPIVSFSSLMLAPELIRIQEKPLANWVTRMKVNAIRGEFMRQCYQALLDTMGRSAVDQFARLFVVPQAGHGLSGSVYGTDGEGKATTPAPIPANYERFAYLVNWVERGTAPGQALEVSAGGRTMPLCSYPRYPKYVSGPPGTASSYTCTAPD